MPHRNYAFSFIDFKLIEVNFRLDRTFEIKEDISINTNMSIRNEWNEDEKVLMVFIRLDFSGSCSPLTLTIEGGGLFKFEHTVASEQLEQIACVNCAALVYPYIRETVSDFIRRAGFPPLYLPPFNFVEAYSQKKKQDTLAAEHKV
jgi:preprotein translocase subunit SecB